MLILRTLCYVALVVCFGLGIASCVSPPDYPDTPEISFKKIETARIVKQTGSYDTVSVTISFKDGDGDLGLDDSDTGFPYSRLDQSGKLNKYYNNYFMTMQVQESSGNYVDLPLGTLDYNSRYPRLSPEAQGSRKTPLRGDLTFGLTITQGTLRVIKPDLPAQIMVRFKVRIVDRALHESNEIITDPIATR
ncbi:hypothetical protein HNQ93_001390 [Hymenobacter luteus]|uniref:DUF1735 domain-containing protein n=2 Tax=Hymenobacter TaxID=89966 RepID=A0A7W9T0E6_9BACT|nr:MULTISPECIES: hypothetical protein [Hymenobacter]MBB4601249.1 hypothetical protein [Hymenobacter latericoloratus]MBB6058544.1 hypothetical protein [Hymenobacter luteus]